MSEPASFLDLCLRKKARAEDIDDFVDAWHADPGGKDLHDYLGMNEEEYSLWLRAPDALLYILEARRDGQPLREIVRQACGGDRSPVSRRLSDWLRERAAE
ncbi:MAG: hypothetical protein ACM3JG_01315 [Thiohalocapsa sp.]